MANGTASRRMIWAVRPHSHTTPTDNRSPMAYVEHATAASANHGRLLGSGGRYDSTGGLGSLILAFPPASRRRRLGCRWRQGYADVHLAQLFVVHRRRGAAHQVGAALGLGEGDHVADVGDAAEDHHQPVQAQGDAAVRRGAVLQGVEEEAEFQLLCRGVDAEQGKELLLHVHAMDTDGAAADLAAVDDDVVGFALDRFHDVALAAVELGQIIVQRGREWALRADAVVP